jgi:hypothetical protein
MRKFLRLLATAQVIGFGIAVFYWNLLSVSILSITFVLSIYLLNKTKHE